MVMWHRSSSSRLPGVTHRAILPVTLGIWAEFPATEKETETESHTTPPPHRIRSVSIKAVIFDWGGTLTPWHSVDHQALWRAVCAAHFPGRGDEVAAAILAAEWRLVGADRGRPSSSATLADVFARAGMRPTEAMLAAYYAAGNRIRARILRWIPLLRELRARGIQAEVLSNTFWPRTRPRAGVPPGRGARPVRRGGVQQRDSVGQAASGSVPGGDAGGRRDRPGQLVCSSATGLTTDVHGAKLPACARC